MKSRNNPIPMSKPVAIVQNFDSSAGLADSPSIRKRPWPGLSIGQIVLSVAALSLLSGAGLFSLSKTAVAAEEKPDPVLAKVNNKDIRESQVLASIESLSLGDQIDVRADLDVYIEALINEEVLLQWALQSGFQGEGELRKEVKDLVVSHLLEKHVRSRIRVDEQEVRDYYNNNPSLIRGEHVRVRSILLRDRAQCEELIEKIDSEDRFAEMAKAHSLDQATAPSGGESGLIMRGEGTRAGYDLAFFDMKVGEMRIFDTKEGCRLVRSVFYTNPPLPPFELVRERIREFLENRREVMLVDQLVKNASQGMTVDRIYRASPSLTAKP